MEERWLGVFAVEKSKAENNNNIMGEGAGGVWVGIYRMYLSGFSR